MLGHYKVIKRWGWKSNLHDRDIRWKQEKVEIPLDQIKPI
jgi:hypothetical protein